MWFFDDLLTNDILFDSVCKTLYSIVNGKVKNIYKYKLMPSFFAFLHTFGRPLNFNPHIHVIIAEGLIDKNHNFKKYNHFNYDALSKRFMKILLDNMEKHFGKKSFKDTKNKMYLKYKNGFYVNNKLEDDGENVTWFYSDHTHEEYHEITESTESFITKILRHLLPSNYKSIRYYGFYNKSNKLCDKLITIIKKEKIPFMRSILKWKNSILTSFNRIPIKCPKYGSLMKLCFDVT